MEPELQAAPQPEEVSPDQPFVSHADAKVSVSGVWHRPKLGPILCMSLLALNTMGFDLGDWNKYQSDIFEVGGVVPLVTQFAPRWGAVFQHDHDVKWLVSGVTNGFSFDFTPPETSDDVPNYVPAEHVHKVSAKLFEEEYLGNIVPTKREDVFFLTALGAVDKDHSNFAKIRIVNDMSRPRGSSLNDCTDIGKHTLSTVKDAFVLLTPYGYLAKLDLSAAYRSLGTSSWLWKYHVFKWYEVVYMDLRVMFGHTQAPSVFQRVTDAVVRRIKAENCPGVIGYLDDYLIASPTKSEALRCYEVAQDVLTFLGFTLAPDKLEPPTQDIVFLGIRLETNYLGVGKLRASITPSRVAKLTAMCTQMASRNYVTRRDLEHLIGLMNFCAQVIWGARLYMRTGYALLHRMPKHRSAGHVNTLPFKADLLQWVRILQLFNGRGMELNRRTIHSDFFSVDASTSTGMGGFLDGLYFSVLWSEFVRWPQKSWYPFSAPETSNINYLELFAIYWGLFLWGARLQGLTVVVWSDNVTAEAYARELWGKAAYIPLLKQIWYLCVEHDIRLLPLRIDTKSNVISDALSRADWVTFAHTMGLGKGCAKALAENNVEMMEHLVTEWEQKQFNVKDFDDWMLIDAFFFPLEGVYGPFTVDAATDSLKTNARSRRAVNKEEDGTRFDYGGHNTYCNPPYSIIILFLLQFLRCKQRCPMGTSAMFILPAWTTYEFWKLLVSLPQVFLIERRFPKGLDMFSSPNTPAADRRVVGPTKWPVVAVWVPPHDVNFEVDWVEWEKRADRDLIRSGVHRSPPG